MKTSSKSSSKIYTANVNPKITSGGNKKKPDPSTNGEQYQKDSTMKQIEKKQLKIQTKNKNPSKK